MAEGIAMRCCTACGRVVFPPRPLCPGCGGAEWRRVLARTGRVEEVTWRKPRRKRKQTPLGHWVERSYIQLASVASDLGPVITVLAPDGDLKPGMAVELESRASVSVARESAELRARRARDTEAPGAPADDTPAGPLPGEWVAPSDPEPSDIDELVPGEWREESGAEGRGGGA
jgi:uncharacterized OB-fold protein